MGMGALVSQCLSAPSEVTTNRSRSAYWCRMLSDVPCSASLPYLRRHANEKRLRDLGPARGTHTFLARRSCCPSQFWRRTTDRAPMSRPHFCVKTVAQHQPAGTTMQSRSRVFGLWTNGNELRARPALSSVPSVKGMDAGR